MFVVMVVEAGRRWWRTGALVLVALFALVGAGCSSGGSTTAEAAGSSTEGIEATPTPSKLRSGAGANPTAEPDDAEPESAEPNDAEADVAEPADAEPEDTESPTAAERGAETPETPTPVAADAEPAPEGAPTEAGVPTPTPFVVTVSPRDDLRQLVNQHDEGTTFLLQAGVHLSARAFPKSNQIFIGEPGAILDGEGMPAPAFSGSRGDGSDGVVIQGLEIRNYQPGIQNAAISARPLGQSGFEGLDWVVTGNVIHDNGGGGINVASGMRIEDNYIYDNRQIGITGLGSGERPIEGLVITNNTIEANNDEPYDDFDYHEGGIKLTGATNAKITKNWIASNWGFGLHCDRQCDDVLIEGNIVRDARAHVGRDDDRAFAAEIYIELSTNVTVRGNEVVVDESVPTGQRDKAIRVNESQNIIVEDNTLVLGDGDADHIMALGHNSCCDRPPTSDTTFRNNTIEATAGTIFVGSRDLDPDGGNVVFENNTYVERGGTFVFKNRGATTTWNDWQRLGFDEGGSLE